MRSKAAKKSTSSGRAKACRRRSSPRPRRGFFGARDARVPMLAPVKIMGRPGAAAGGFLGVREMLKAGGADVTGLLPFSPIEPYLREHGHVFWRITCFAPGRLPPFAVDTPAYDA